MNESNKKTFLAEYIKNLKVFFLFLLNNSQSKFNLKKI